MAVAVVVALGAAAGFGTRSVNPPPERARRSAPGAFAAAPAVFTEGGNASWTGGTRPRGLLTGLTKGGQPQDATAARRLSEILAGSTAPELDLVAQLDRRGLARPAALGPLLRLYRQGAGAAALEAYVRRAFPPDLVARATAMAWIETAAGERSRRDFVLPERPSGRPGRPPSALGDISPAP